MLKNLKKQYHAYCALKNYSVTLNLNFSVGLTMKKGIKHDGIFDIEYKMFKNRYREIFEITTVNFSDPEHHFEN